VKAIHALGLLALCIGATFAGPLSTAELEPETGDRLHLMYDFEQPLTGGEDPKLLAATTTKVLELARKHGVPVQRDPDLLATLEPLDVNSLIPPDLFQAVAVVLAALYRANKGSHT